MIWEIIGYAGSALVVISMLMSSILKLRIINTAGSIISCVYAIVVGAMPLALMNACLIIINLYNLYRLMHTKKPYDIAVCSSDDGIVGYFLDYYKDDISLYFPEFDKSRVRGDRAYAVMCEGSPSGILIGRAEGGCFDIDIDYTTPSYRDFSIAGYLYKRLPEYGINKIRYAGSISESHADYLRRMGYSRSGDEWILSI